MSFDLANYVDVPARIRAFNEKYPEGSLSAEWQLSTFGDKTYIIVVAKAFRNPLDPAPGVGHAAELYPGTTPYTRDSELMNAETSAWGRAIQALGFDFGKVASTEEVAASKARQEAFTKASRAAAEPSSDPFPDEPFPSAEPESDAPYCAHGYMTHKTGTSKATGNDWSGWFCTATEKTEQCKPIWDRS